MGGIDGYNAVLPNGHIILSTLGKGYQTVEKKSEGKVHCTK